MGEKWSEKKQSPRISWTQFFFRPFLPHVWDSVFFQSSKTVSALDTPSCNFSEPGIWILTKRGYRHPVLVLPYPNSVQVLGMEQPTPHSIFLLYITHQGNTGGFQIAPLLQHSLSTDQPNNKQPPKRYCLSRFFNHLINRKFLAILEFDNTKETVSDQVPC